MINAASEPKIRNVTGEKEDWDQSAAESSDKDAVPEAKKIYAIRDWGRLIDKIDKNKKEIQALDVAIITNRIFGDAPGLL